MMYGNYGELDEEKEDFIEIKSCAPKISIEEAIRIASKSFLKFKISSKNNVSSVKLLYKPFSLFLYRAIIKHRKYIDRPPENITMYIAVDMITGVGFESETLDTAIIKVEKKYVVEPLISVENALNEVKRVILKFKLKIAKQGLEVTEENISPLGLVYKPIWIIEFNDRKKKKYIGVDAVKGVKV